VAGSALFHELGKDTGFVRVFPALRQQGEHAVPDAAVVPIRNNRGTIGFDAGVVHLVGGHGAGVEYPQVFRAVAAYFGKGGYFLRRGTAFAHDKLAVAQIQFFVRAQRLERKCAHHRNAVAAALLAVEFGKDFCAFG